MKAFAIAFAAHIAVVALLAAVPSVAQCAVISIALTIGLSYIARE